MSDALILPRGITGFCEREGATPPPVDLKAFARACHAAARLELGRIEGVEPAGVARNHHRSILRRRGVAVAVLCNAHFPWIAFAAADDGLPLTPRFIEEAPLASRFEALMSCRVLGLSALEASPASESLADLSAAERRQIRYWRPGRLGDVVFNWWD